MEVAVPHLFRKKPHLRQLSQAKSYCPQTRVPRFTRAGSSIVLLVYWIRSSKISESTPVSVTERGRRTRAHTELH
jgi:hypothetical protein